MCTAAAIGAGGFSLLGEAIDPYHPAVVRASMGACFGQRVVRTRVTQPGRWVQQHKLTVVRDSSDGVVD